MSKRNIYVEAARCHERLKDYDAAIEFISKAIELAPSDKSLYASRKSLFSAIGESSLADYDDKKLKDLNKATEKAHGQK